MTNITPTYPGTKKGAGDTNKKPRLETKSFQTWNRPLPRDFTSQIAFSVCP